MLYSIKNRQGLENLNELISLQNQVKALKIQDRPGKQIFHEDLKNVFEPLTKIIKHTSQDVTKTITETSIENNKTLQIFNDKLL